MDCEKCFHYWNNGKEEYCETRGWDFRRTDCPDFRDKSKPKTNADRIRAMSDEELAQYICKTQYREGDVCPPTHNCAVDKSCEKCWLDWLRQEVSTDGN